VRNGTINVRQGPGASYAILTTAKPGQAFEIKGRNPDNSWLQLCCFDGKSGWISAPLLEVTGDLAGVSVPADMPTPVPTATAAPTVAPPTAAPGQPTAAPGQATAAPAKAAPAPAPKGGGPGGVLLYSVASKANDRWELWQYNFANGESKFLKEWRTEVAFSPDYKQFVYFGWPQVMGEKPGLYIGNADLSNENFVILGGAYPSFSPGGDRLSAQGGPKIYVLNTDGNGLHAITEGEYPDWSPIDNWIAHRACYGGDCGLWLTNADSGERRRLTTGGGDGQPAWSPNGQQLAYISKDDGNFEIYRINRDGSNKVRLTNTPQSDGLPIWSPDGQWIAFRSDRDGKWAIYVMRPDGSDVRKVVDADVLPLWFWEKLAWRP
jgi:uncharacterized protein YraI